MNDKPHDPPRQRPWLRRTAFVVACLCLGAVVTVGVAWYGVLSEDALDGEVQSGRFHDWAVMSYVTPRVTILVGNDDVMNWRNWAPLSEHQVPQSSLLRVHEPELATVNELAAGRPWRCLRCAAVYPKPVDYWRSSAVYHKALEGRSPGARVPFDLSESALPIGVLPLGFAANTLSIAGVWAALLSLVPLARSVAHRGRRRAGRCVSCRHTLLSTQVTCPECGWTSGSRQPWFGRRTIAMTFTCAAIGAISLTTFAMVFHDGAVMRPIHLAAKAGDVAGVRAELDRGTRPDLLVSDERATPMTIAIQHDRMAIVHLLLEHTVPTPDDLYCAVLSGRDDVIALLFEHGLNPLDTTVAARAAFASGQSGRVETLWTLVDAGLIPDPEASWWQRSLEKACVGHHWDLADALTNLGVTPGGSALPRLLVYRDPILFIRTLLATDMTCDTFDETPYSWWMMEQPDVASVQLLINLGMSPIQPDEDGYTPLHCAVQGTDPLPVARVLLDAGADPNAPCDTGGYTPFHWAAYQNGTNEELIRLLFKHRADPHLESDDGKTPLDLLGDTLEMHGQDVDTLYGEYLREQ